MSPILTNSALVLMPRLLNFFFIFFHAWMWHLAWGMLGKTFKDIAKKSVWMSLSFHYIWIQIITYTKYNFNQELLVYLFYRVHYRFLLICANEYIFCCSQRRNFFLQHIPEIFVWRLKFFGWIKQTQPTVGIGLSGRS